MAVNTAFFLFAFVHSHAGVPAHAPVKAPVPSPKKAPVHAPAHAPTNHHHVPPPKKAPIQTPEKPHVHPPLEAPSTPVAPIHGCVAMCEEYCKPVSPKRPCMRVCTACCAKYKCVPVGSKKCTNWGRVMIHGEMVKCP
ncbi:Hypothetical predicted protein [Olea europaea subsp. europaea]|uniref:Uncharacterized protein n=1 Tax=Olea europaea subsp. europaea TaxID=158383 RepID=A0A8S0SNR1_OLEEU|nr:Hypothetical predicted protein [Olea europaea subsp. europaea]